LTYIKEHTAALLVAAAIVAAAFAEGLFQPMGYAGASVVIWVAVVAGLASRALPATPVTRYTAIAGLCLAATVVLATGSVAWASDQGRAFEEAVRASFYLGLFTLASCTASIAGRREWLAGLTVGLGIVSVIALLAYLQPGLLDSERSDIPNAAGRLSYPIGYWNGAAALLAVAATLAVYASVKAPTRGLRSICVGVIPIAWFGIWLASSRGGAVAACLGVAVLVAASRDRLRLSLRVAISAAAAAALIVVGDGMHALTSGAIDAARRADGDRMSGIVVGAVVLSAALAWAVDGLRPSLRLSRWMKVAAAAAAAVAVIVAVVAANPAERFRDFKAAPATGAGSTIGNAGLSSNGRWQFWSGALDAFEGKPIEGVGAGGYEDWWAQHATVPLFVRNPHSLPLQQAAELGLPGFLLFAGFVVVLGTAAVRRLATGLEGDAGILIAVVVAGAVGAATDWTWEIPAAFSAVVITAGLLTASAPGRVARRDTYWLGAGTVAAAWLAMIAGGLVVLSEVELKQSRTAATHERVAEGVRKAQDAHTVLPWSAEPYTQLALLDEQRGDIDGALANLRSAEERDGEDWRLPLIEARLQKRRGDGRAARLAIRRAQRLGPLLPIFNTSEAHRG
jgi:hypothetical protein